MADIGAPTNFQHGVGGMVQPGQTDNLTDLENLTEETLLLELAVRYKRNTIYTYVGDILCAINPFKAIPGLYDAVKASEYSSVGSLSNLPPHIFATADQAFTNMAENSGAVANQVVVISGESGAGKTESAKLFMKHVIHLSKLKSTEEKAGDMRTDAKSLEEKIIQLNPLLEAFGNAQTLMNDNSSRFGKFTELRFNRNLAITGAKMKEYLLEKSRIIEQSEGERNFHIFYLFLAGVRSRREDYQLGDPGEHRIINSNDEAIDEIEESKPYDMFQEVSDCFRVVGFSEEETDNLFHLLAGILHLGDVEFGGEEDAAYVVSSDDNLVKVATQLGVDKDALKEALVKMTSTTKGEKVERHFKQFQAEDGRDALAKAIYEYAFSWIFKRCNGLLGPAKVNANDKYIGILDIFGFETFDTNSFEQLLINLANEQLQFFFNNHIFSMELKEYAAEGIDGSKVKYEDNTELLDVLLGRMGMLALCDEEAKIPQGTDATMLEKFHGQFAKNKCYDRPRGDEPEFSVQHYAGKVTYSTEGFLEKNRDTLAIDVVAVMRLSENPLVRSLFGGEPKKDGKSKRGKGLAAGGANRKELRKSMKRVKADAMKGNKKTVGTTFKQSLKELMEQMNLCAPHFIRCLKPNLQKQADNFKVDLVTRQLRYTGMLETTRIRKEGYAHRPTFEDFLNRYKIIGFPLMSTPPATSGSCTRVLQKSGIDDWQVGRTKVFLRYYHPPMLGKVMAPYPNAAACIQNMARGFLARQQVGKLLDKAKQEAKIVSDFCSKAERQMEGTRSVLLVLCDEDAMRPPDYFSRKKSQVKKIKDPTLKRMQKKADKSKAGITRAKSIKWFQEVEMKKGAGQTDEGDGFELWFHGIITRNQSEGLLLKREPGAFLVRVSESRFGYSLSHYVAVGKRIKHYMIDQTPDGQYQVVGNTRLFPSLNDLVAHHRRHKIVATDPVCLIEPCGQEEGHNDLEEIVQD